MKNRGLSEKKAVFEVEKFPGGIFGQTIRKKYMVYNEIIQLLKGTDMEQVKERIKSGAIKIKNHVVRHKAAYAFGGLAVTAVVLQKQQAKAFEGFLVEKGIDPMEFYLPDSITAVTV
jgi:hypothetical protein